jgi:hypothetical protein
VLVAGPAATSEASPAASDNFRIGAHELHVLRAYQRPREKKLRLEDLHELFGKKVFRRTTRFSDNCSERRRCAHGLRRLIESGKIGVKEIERLIQKLEIDKEILADQEGHKNEEATN